MRLGVVLRTMGEQSTRETLLGSARAAEAAGLDELWVVDHVAIPPDDAEGSGGRYLDPLARSPGSRARRSASASAPRC